MKAAPAEEVKAPAKVETKKAEKKPAAKKAAVPAKKEETKAVVATKADEVKTPAKATPKKSGRKSSAEKTAAKTAPAKKETKTAATPVEKPAEKAKKAPEAKKAAPAKATNVVTTSVLQVSGNEFDFDKVVKAVEGLKKKNVGKNLEIYIKPEDRAIYYVVNGKGGKKIDL